MQNYRFSRFFMFFCSDSRGNPCFYVFPNYKKTADAYGEIDFTKTKIVRFLYFRLNRGLQNR